MQPASRKQQPISDPHHKLSVRAVGALSPILVATRPFQTAQCSNGVTGCICTVRTVKVAPTTTAQVQSVLVLQHLALGITSPLSPCCDFRLGDSDAAEHTSSISDTDDGTDSSEAHASAEVDGEAASDVDAEVDPLSGAKRLQDLSEDDYEEPAEPAVDVAELVKYALFRMGKLA